MKKTMLILLSILFIASYANANYIQNGSFETPDISADGDAYYGWQVYSEDYAVANWRNPFGAGIEIQESGTVVTAQDGDQYVELDSDHRRGGDSTKDSDGNYIESTNSTMGQLVELTAGTYILDFYYQPRVVGNSDTNQITYGVMDIFTDPPAGFLAGSITGAARNGWEEIANIFKITDDGTYCIFFAAVGTADSYGGFIDNVTLEAAPVPEPATLILLGSGLAGLAFYRRKRK